MAWIKILTLIGSVGLVLFGMKLLSEGLQKIVGDGLRKAESAMTKNRFTGMLTGILVSILIQSSAATTVMIVSFVNTGMISLQESMAVIMGVNVGTTATTWIIALLGFRFNIFHFVFPLIALSLPLFNSRKSTNNSWGEFLIGFSLMFLGIGVLNQITPEMLLNSHFLDLIHTSCTWGYYSVLFYLFLGIILTICVQKSSAAFIFAALFSANGWISFYIACAIVLGSNIGTCLMPVIASRSALPNARRAGMGHLLFNIVGVIWALCLYYPFCDFIAYLCECINIGNPAVAEDSTLGLALFHTLFNILNLCLLLPLLKQFVALISKLIPDTNKKEESFKLQFIDQGYIESGEMALLQVKKETSRYADETYAMFKLFKEMINDKVSIDNQLLYKQRIKSMEEESDRAELEIAQFLNQISSNSLSLSGEQLSRSLYKIVDELESVADSIFNLSANLYQKNEQRIAFNSEMQKEVNKMLGLVDEALLHMLKVLSSSSVPGNSLDKAYNYEDEINNLRNQLRNEMLDSVESKQIEYLQKTYFMILINEFEKVGDHVINVIAAASEK